MQLDYFRLNKTLFWEEISGKFMTLFTLTYQYELITESLTA